MSLVFGTFAPAGARRALGLFAALVLAAACSDNLAPILDVPSEFVARKRAWLPGERDSLIARYQRDTVLVIPYGGDLNAYLDQILDPDSVVEVVTNPDFSLRAADASLGLLVMAPRFATSWNIFGVKVVTINTTPTPDDTISLLGVFWSNPAETDWKGFVLAAATVGATTFPRTHVESFTFDSAFSKIGVGGGEVRASTGTFWYATGGSQAGANNTIEITASAFGAPASVTTGPFLGGTIANGSMQGRLRTITMPRQMGASAPATANVDFDFRGTAITAISLRCVFPSPCTTNVPFATEYVTERRAWLPGERDSMIARVARTRQLSLPYVGDLSDNAADILPLDSVTEIVPNPSYLPASAAAFGMASIQRAAHVPGAGWTTFGLDLRVVNNNPGEPDYDWLGAIWFNNADSTWKGIILGASAGTTLPATAVNTTNFDNAGGATGVGAGEARASDGTFWQANGTGAPNTFTVGASFFFGTTTTVTTGPYLGGTSRQGLMNININNVGLTRVLGAGAPATQTASLSGWIGAAQLTCIFPTPCTTNVPLMARFRP